MQGPQTRGDRAAAATDRRVVGGAVASASLLSLWAVLATYAGVPAPRDYYFVLVVVLAVASPLVHGSVLLCCCRAPLAWRLVGLLVSVAPGLVLAELVLFSE